MEMYDVLSKLKAIENPNEDQVRAIQSAEAMNNPTNPSAKPAENTLIPETQEISATGEGVYQPVAQETPTEYARLAGLQTLNVQTDAPETTTESVEIEEAKPDFLDLDKDGDKEESMKKAAKDKEEEVKEEDTTPEQYEKNERVTEEEVETIELDEAYDPAHVKSIVDKHEKEGHKVQMDRPEDDAQGFTVTFKDGKKRHYKYTKGGVKVQSLAPDEPMDDGEKRGRGRPKKESEELNLDSMMEDFEKKYTEQLNEGVTLTQSIDDQGNENVNVSANGDHVDMIKNLLKLSGMRSDGYKEYEGEEEAVEEEREIEYSNTPKERVADVDTQLNKMSGGVNEPKPKSAAKSNSFPLHEKEEDLAESMMDLYKEYKDSE